MGHLTSRDAYRNLSDRINWFTQGAPESETLYKILQVLYTEKEAKWVALLPVRPFTLKKAARVWGTTEAKAEKLLDTSQASSQVTLLGTLLIKEDGTVVPVSKEFEG